ncbi:MAG: hypothetical protein QOE90_926 [Thermoplasmata archaeon]|jgi:hypothetical protein|nr:hypothetical protein [Thermoplasmata archaeon]
MPESRWDPGAGGLAIGTAAARVFAQAFPFVRFPYRTQIRVFNRSGSTLAFVFNGDTPRTVGPNDSVTFNAQSGVGLVRYYTVTPSGVALVAGQVEIVEEGGLSASA